MWSGDNECRTIDVFSTGVWELSISQPHAERVTDTLVWLCRIRQDVTDCSVIDAGCLMGDKGREDTTDVTWNRREDGLTAERRVS